MRKVKAIQTAQSIAHGKLVSENTWGDAGESMAAYWFFGLPLLAILWFFPYDVTHYASANEWIFSCGILSPAALALGYMVYRTATERKLWKVRTPFSKADNQAKILHFLSNRSDYYTTKRVTRELIVAQTYLDETKRHGNTLIFFPENQVIYFCVLASRRRIQAPSLVSPWLLRADLARLDSQ